MKLTPYIFFIIFLTLVGCNQTREEVITFNEVGRVVSKGVGKKSQNYEIDNELSDQEELALNMYGAVGFLMVALMEGSSRPNPVVYIVRTDDNKMVKSISKFNGFENGDCVFVRKVNGLWRMGYAYTCAPPDKAGQK